jgi:hypothetical protein
MPLRVNSEHENERAELAAKALFHKGGVALNPHFRADADMGQFWTANNTTEETALVTDSAATCQIILIHCSGGVGALGHFVRLGNAADTFAGIQEMARALANAPIDSILLAAGHVNDDMADQRTFELDLTGRVHANYPGATLIWPAKHLLCSACIYMPLAAEAALFDSFPGKTASALSKSTNGLTPYRYQLPG